jgi:hypothetical protein
MKKFTIKDLKTINLPITKEVEIPEIDMSFTIMKLKSDPILKLQKYIVDGKPANDDYYFNLIALSVIDDKYKTMLSVDDAKELDSLIFSKLLEAIGELNGLDKASADKAKVDAKNPNLSSIDSSVSN